VKTDLSVAPEIAQLAMPLMHVPPPSGSTPRQPATTGQLAAGLSILAAAPQRWWDLVRFNPDGPAAIAVPAPFDAWLLVIPPGHKVACRCDLATLVAGEADVDSTQLRQGRVRVHGAAGEHVHVSVGHGYSVSLHVGQREAASP
jgi:hypothetical protein